MPQDPLVGALLGGRYRIEHVLADGVTARRYTATDERTGERSVVKVMYGDYASIDRHRRRFAREVEIGSRLCHPNVLAVVDAGETPAGIPYLITVYIAGTCLAQMIEREAPLGARRAHALISDLAQGLEHLHELGFIHRGLTADAITVTQFRDAEAAIITDLGIAFHPRADVTMGRMTQTGKVVGPPAYMSPEQSIGGHLDHRSDLYSLGVVLYELLCGRTPFEGSAIALASQNLGAVPLRMHARVPGLRVHPYLETIAMRLLEKDPEHRFQTARDLLEALAASTLGMQ